MEWSRLTILNRPCLILQVDPNFILHYCIKHTQNMLRLHALIIFLGKFVISERESFLDGRYDWILHILDGLLDHVAVLRTNCFRKANIYFRLDVVDTLQIGGKSFDSVFIGRSLLYEASVFIMSQFKVVWWWSFIFGSVSLICRSLNTLAMSNALLVLR